MLLEGEGVLKLRGLARPRTPARTEGSNAAWLGITRLRLGLVTRSNCSRWFLGLGFARVRRQYSTGRCFSAGEVVKQHLCDICATSLLAEAFMDILPHGIRGAVVVGLRDG